MVSLCEAKVMTQLDVLSFVTATDIRAEPYAYLTKAGALPAETYAALEAKYLMPNVPTDAPQNYLLLGDPFSPEFQEVMSDLWKEFADYHRSPAFFASVMGHLGDQIRATHPDLEDKIGCRLEEAACSWSKSDEATPFKINCQFSYNTPVTELSSVRDAHLDKTRRLVSGLFYFKLGDDDAGGDLGIYRFKGARKFVDVYAPMDALELAEIVPYEANRITMFVNSPDAVHAVQPRKPTPHLRRYINLYIDYKEPLFDLGPYQIRN